MSFTQNAQNVRVDDGHILRADIPNAEGNVGPAELDLDTIIGNNFGNFEWGGTGFSGSAQDITFSLEGGENVPILRAQLNDNSGNTVGRDINLAERITNNNGQLVFN